MSENSSNELRFVPVGMKDQVRLWNLFQKFLYEMTNYYDDELDEEGNLHYGHFESYFCGDPERQALFLYQKETMVGFAMLNRYSHIGAQIDHALAEFTVFPMYRRRHIACKAAQKLFDMYRGAWEIKYNEKNEAAQALWNKVTQQYAPKVTHLNESETVLNFKT